MIISTGLTPEVRVQSSTQPGTDRTRRQDWQVLLRDEAGVIRHSLMLDKEPSIKTKDFRTVIPGGTSLDERINRERRDAESEGIPGDAVREQRWEGVFNYSVVTRCWHTIEVD